MHLTASLDLRAQSERCVPLGDRARHMAEHPLWFFLYFTVSFLEPREVGTMCVQTPRISR